MKLVFFGEDTFSAHVVESLILDGHQIMAVFCPMYQNHIHARLELISKKHQIEFYRVNDINSADNEAIIKSLKPELIVVCHFEKVLKKNIINIPLLGCINLHPSLLPHYRGLSPQHWPIINGDDETGITVHFINEGIDTGNIILQQKIKIESDMHVASLQQKMLVTYKHIVKDAIELIMAKKTTPILQNSSEGSYYGKLQENQCTIELQKGCDAAYNLIRGVSEPYYGAQLNGYKIWNAVKASKALDNEIQVRYDANDLYLDANLGMIIKFSDGSLIVNKYSKINN